MTETLAAETPVEIRPFGTVTKDRYLSADFAAREADHLWNRVWQVACHEDEIPNVGDFLEFTIGDQPLLLVRSSADRVEAFYNTCLHRGAIIKTGTGNVTDLRCPYHGWRWYLDGSIAEVTDRHDFAPACVTDDDLTLPSCQADRWGGFVWINLDRHAPPLGEYLAPVPERLERFHLGDCRLTGSWSTQLAANWKTVIDAFNETYHAQGVHPESLLFHDDTSWTYHQFSDHAMFRPRPDAFGVASPRLGFDLDPGEVLVAMADTVAQSGLLSSDLTDQISGVVELIPDDQPLGAFIATMLRGLAGSIGLEVEDLVDADLILGESWTVFPNLIISVNGVSPVIWRARPCGPDPEVCIVDTWTVRRFGAGFDPPEPARHHYEDWRTAAHWPNVWAQDLRVIPTVQRGMHSRTFIGHQRLGRSDANIAHFHTVLDRYLTDLPDVR